MSLTIEFLIFSFGLVMLLKGADYFVDSSSNLAIKLGVSPLFIGLTLVAFGTSAPEAAVSIQAGIKESSDIAFGNIVGSNIANIGLVLGLTALIIPVRVMKSSLNKELPFVILTTLALFFMAFDHFIEGAEANYLSRSDGIVLLIFFLIFIEYTFNMALSDRQSNEKIDSSSIEKETAVGSNTRYLLIALVSIAAVVFGGNLVVRSGINIARHTGVSEAFIAVTMIALGTSLPELATSLVAIYKKKHEIALGNIIGSCVFNILFVLGFASAINPITINSGFIIDMSIAILLAVFVFIFALHWRRTAAEENYINRLQGFVLLMVYFAYISYAVIRL